MKTTIQYTCIHLPTGKRISRKETFDSVLQAYQTVNDWNRIGQITGQLTWFYFIETEHA